jgi:3-methyladenine DNA glycosylase AlkD
MCSLADEVLVDEIRAALHAAADPVRAPQMQRYMKSAMPFLGVPLPAVRAAVRAASAARPPQTTDELRDTTLLLWRAAGFREERYAATALTGLPIARRLQTPRLVPLYDEMIRTGAWWDHVDELAGRIGALLLAHPDELRPVVRSWMRADDRWLRRASVICQRGAKERTDLALLAAAIDANAADPDFFLRKAIGWALRSYAYTDAAWVRAFVAERQDSLSPLSRREALKHIGDAQLRS